MKILPASQICCGQRATIRRNPFQYHCLKCKRTYMIRGEQSENEHWKLNVTTGKYYAITSQTSN